MIVTKNDKLVEFVMSKLYTERVSRLSVTDLVGCKRAAVLKRHHFKKKLDVGNILSMSEGRGTHLLLKDVFEITEDEKVKDGVVGHIDAIYNGKIVEFYTTTMSPNNTIEQMIRKSVYFCKKLRQIMAYCYMEGTDQAELLILFRFGENRKPVLKAFTLVFSEEELKMNWQMIVEKRGFVWVWDDREVDDIRKIEADPLMGECNYCGYSYMCVDMVAEKGELA